jgi:4-hydroxy-tetrahydrodipicolinate reductase
MKIAIMGAAGRMGQTIFSLAKNDKDIEISGAFECDKNSQIYTENSSILPACQLEKALVLTEVIIDFTNPESSLKTIDLAEKSNVAIILGTTGFTEKQHEIITKAAKSIPVLLSPNMSVGVNILFKLIQEAVKIIPHYDIEIVELHHNKKKDAPSGTALKLAEIAAKSIGKNINEVGIYGRKGITGERAEAEIGVMSVRAGDIVGDHTVYLAGPGERIELTHRAHSRDAFAAGAIRAAKWIAKKPAGLYDMSDVLALK